MANFVYCWENTTNNKKYIGKTSNLKLRYKNHQVEFRTNRHHNEELMNDYNRGDKFRFYIIERVINPDDLDIREKYYIKLFFDNCYNLAYTDKPFGKKDYNGKKRIHLDIDIELFELLEKYAQKTSTPITKVIRVLLWHTLQGQK